MKAGETAHAIPVPDGVVVAHQPAIPLAAWIGLCVGGGLLVGFAFPADRWYGALTKPAWTPPGIVFAPVWTILYVMMGVAAWRIDRGAGARRRYALWLFAAQLALNLAWTPVFFGVHSPGAALAVIVVLWMTIAATVVAFLRIDRMAGWLMAPYLAWVTFAAALNLAIWRLN